MSAADFPEDNENEEKKGEQGSLSDKVNSAKNLKNIADKAHSAGKFAQGAAGAGGNAASGAGASAAGAGSAAAGSAAGGAAAGTAAGAAGGAAGGGAAAGAAAGSVVPGAGTAAGAVVGTVVGSAASSNTGRKVLIGAGLGGCGCFLFLIFAPIFILLLIFITILGGGDSGPDLPNQQSKILVITKTASPQILPKGSAGQTASVAYNFAVENKGEKEATDVKISDSFSGKYKDQTTGQETCNFDIGTVAAHSSTTRACTVSVNKLDDDWILSNVASLSGTIDGISNLSSSNVILKIGNPKQVDPSGWPLGGEITQLPWCNTTDHDACPSHGSLAAVDIAVVKGTPVHATQDGVATFKMGDSSYGNYILVTGESYTTRYAHLDSINYACVGDSGGKEVTAGAVVGFSGNTGHVISSGGGGGYHLHYELMYSDTGAQVPLRNLSGLLPSYTDGQNITGSYAGEGCGG